MAVLENPHKGWHLYQSNFETYVCNQPSWIKRSLAINAILCLALSVRSPSTLKPICYPNSQTMLSKADIDVCLCVCLSQSNKWLTSVWLSGVNHRKRTPRCTTAGIILKSNGVVTYKIAFVRSLLLMNSFCNHTWHTNCKYKWIHTRLRAVVPSSSMYSLP